MVKILNCYLYAKKSYGTLSKGAIFFSQPCINLASQIGYDSTNNAFIFYKNQIPRLMDESPYDKKKFEVQRASSLHRPVP